MKNETLRKLILPLTCLLSGIGVVIQTLLLVYCYDPIRGLYQSDTPYLILPVVFLVALILAIATFLMTPKSQIPLPVPGKKNSPLSTGPLAKIGALFLLIGAILSGILLFYGNFLSDHAADLLFQTDSPTNTIAIAANLTKISAYLGILAAVYPALLLITGKGDGIFGMITALWMLLLDLSIYFDNTVVLNDPVRLLTLVGLSAAVLWMTADLRLILKRASRRAFRLYGIVLLPILFASSLPMLIATAMGILDFTSRTLLSVALFGVALLILGREIDLTALPDGADQKNQETPVTPADSADSEDTANSIHSTDLPDSDGEADSDAPATEGDAEKEKFSLKRELRRMMDAPDTDLYSLPDPDDEDENDESGFLDDGDGMNSKNAPEDGETDIFDISDLTRENSENSDENK